MLCRQTPIQWLYEELIRFDFNLEINKDSQGRITWLFYAHPTARQLIKQNPDVLLLDCTYKTNRFDMPLLNFCRVTSNNKTLQFALCFLSREKKEDYKWALDQYQSMMIQECIKEPKCLITDRELALIHTLKHAFPSNPHILYHWHMNMNVICKGKEHFRGKSKEE